MVIIPSGNIKRSRVSEKPEIRYGNMKLMLEI